VLNRVVLVGRLTADPELRQTQSGLPVANFTLAVDRKFSKDKETDFINIIAWRGLAENCANYLTKGKLAAVDGRLQIRQYEDKQGQKRTIAEVVADNVRFLSPAEKRPVENQQGERPWPGTDGDPVHVPDLDNDDDLPVYDEQDLPF
jgi:single-strand DNA-binding protein